MALGLSRRCDSLVHSEIRNMSLECEKVGGLNLSQGVCDMEIPLPVVEGARAAILAGQNSYTRYDGIKELRVAIAKKSKDYNGITADPESEIIVSGGSTGAFYSACLALLDPGDEVILFEPYYGYHRITLEAAQGVATYVRLRLPDWTFTAEDLEKAFTPRTRGIMVNTPANPSGKVFTAGELATIQKFAEKHDLFIFTDEIYEYIVYDGRKHISPGSLPGAAGRTITISGYSKTFSVTGWRVGYSISDAKWARMIGYMSDLVYVCAPSPLQAEAVSCTGNRYCSFALIPTKSTAQAVVEELDRRLELPHGVRTHWTGCPNACGQPYMGQIGLMGAKARKDGQMVEAVKIFLGGSMDSNPKLAELHDKGVPLSDLPDVLEQLLVERFGARRRASPG